MASRHAESAGQRVLHEVRDRVRGGAIATVVVVIVALDVVGRLGLEQADRAFSKLLEPFSGP